MDTDLHNIVSKQGPNSLPPDFAERIKHPGHAIPARKVGHRCESARAAFVPRECDIREAAFPEIHTKAARIIVGVGRGSEEI